MSMNIETGQKLTRVKKLMEENPAQKLKEVVAIVAKEFKTRPQSVMCLIVQYREEVGIARFNNIPPTPGEVKQAQELFSKSMRA